MKVIGLCGGSGSGKSAASELLEKIGIPHIDADGIYRDLTSYESDCMRALKSEFGDAVMNEDGSLNRDYVRELVFSGNDRDTKRARLNEITHKYVLSEIDKQIEKYKSEGREAVIADVPLLFESGFNEKCDFTVAVVADEAVRIDRIVRRDKITKEQAKARINAQISTDELISKVDFVLENNGDLDELEKAVMVLYEKMIK
jgi:dephospho-CoA kinase